MYVQVPIGLIYFILCFISCICVILIWGNILQRKRQKMINELLSKLEDKNKDDE